MKRNPLSKITQHYTNQKKKKALGLMKALIQGIEKERFTVQSQGYWLNDSRTIIAKFELSFDDFGEVSDSLHELS